MFSTDHVISLYNKGFSRKSIADQVYSYNKNIQNIITKEEALKFVECVIVDYITSPSL